jgi:hypothetical protein
MSVENFQIEEDAEGRHPITWSCTNVPDGFVYSNANDIGVDVAWQFHLHDAEGKAKRNGWRVHGYLQDGTFHIVWLDPNHALDGTPIGSAKKRRNRK